MATKTAPINTTPIDARSCELRKQIVKAIKAGNRGHVGSSFSLVEIFRVLYDDVLKFDAKNPRWGERDRCILSKGHGCLALYAVLADKSSGDSARPMASSADIPSTARSPASKRPQAAWDTASPSVSAWRSTRVSRRVRTASSW
jgi:hypothetical protein